jgi:hypothetical protein
MSMHASAGDQQPAWGGHSLVFAFPQGSLHVSDLSEVQLQGLRALYPEFLPESGVEPRIDARCRVFQLPLEMAEWIDSVPLSRGGVYAPHKVRDGSRLALTGEDFMSTIDLSSSDATLGVMNEQEVASPGVFENFYRIFSAYQVLGRGGTVLHSAGLVFEDRAYVFAGCSGSGKTTLSRKALGASAKVLSDDLNVVLPDQQSDTGYVACAVPFAGELGRTLAQRLDTHYPLSALVLLEQSDELKVETLPRVSALSRLLAQSPYVNSDEYELPALIESIDTMLARVPVLRLYSSQEDSANAIFRALQAALTP